MNLIIERIFIAVLLLSISGFVFCAVYLPLEKYAYRLTSARTMVTVNTVALFSFFLPFYFISAIRDGSEYRFQHKTLLVFENVSSYEGLVSNVREFGFVEYLGTIWLLGAVAFLVFYALRYLCSVNNAIKSKFYINDDIWYEKFKKIKNESNVPNVNLIGCFNIPTPCTFGIRNKYIAIPPNMINSFDEEEIEFILKHEFYHVTRNDLPRKLLMTLLNCINWFNPLYYFLRNNLLDWIEAACDEEVTKDFNKAQRFKYCNLILKIVELEKDLWEDKDPSINFIGLNMKNYKKRMMKVMGKNKSSVLGKAAVGAMAVVAMISGNVVAKAADMPINMMFSKNVEIVNSNDVKVIEEPIDFTTKEFVPLEHEKSNEYVEVVLKDTANITYEIFYDEGSEMTIKIDPVEPQHEHTIVSITISEHRKFSDGSCTITYYDGEKCTSCGKTWKGDRISVTTFDKCIH